MVKTNDLTDGKVSKVFLNFFFPMLFTNLLQQLYSFVDMAIVGKGIGDNAFAAVGNISALTLLIIGFAQGITNGFSVIIAYFFGKKDETKLRKSIANSIKLSLILSVILTIFGIFFLKKILIIMNTDVIILKESLVYGYIIFGGIIITLAYNLCSCILRALGDSKTPFLAIMISAIVNIILDCILIYIFKTGVGGAGIATVMAQLGSVVFCVIRFKKLECMKLTKEDFENNLPLSIELLKNGIPMAFMNSITAIGCIIVQGYVNELGVIYTSAYSACNKYISFFMLPSITAGFAMSAFTSQNNGAQKYDRIKLGLKVALMIGFISYLVLGSTMILYPKTLLKIFLTNKMSIDLGTNFLKVCGTTFLMLNFLLIYRSTLQGMEKPFVPMFSGILEMGLRIVVIMLLLPHVGFIATAYAEGIAWLGALMLNFFSYLFEIKKKKQVI